MEEGKDLTVARVDNSPAAMMIRAMDGKMDLTQLEKFMELQKAYEANQARKEYNLAMADFKAESIVVIKDKTNSQYKSKYASESALLNTVNPILSKHSLSASYSYDQTDGYVKATCTIAHAGGHKESVSLTGPLDTSGQKNPLQQIKSTVTYLKKATFEAITGIASSDDDDDGNGAGGVTYIDEKQLSAIMDYIGNPDYKIQVKAFLGYMKAESVEKILSSDYQKAIAALKATADKVKSCRS